MKVNRVYLAGLLALVLTYGCTFNNIQEDVAPPPPAVDPCDTMAVSFADTIFPIITRTCADTANGSCHWAGNGSRPEWINYANIKAKIDEGRIQARIFDQNPGPMPPPFTTGPPILTNCEKTLIQRWIDDGAPDN